MLYLYNEVIYRPLLNLLIFSYHYIPDIGVVIVLLTLLIRLIMAPSFHKQIKSQKALTDLQPKLNELKEKYKGDKEGQAKAMMGLYKEHKINPLSSCLPLIIQLPILIALYQVFSKALNNHLAGLYSFVVKPEVINPYFFGLLNLSKPSIILGILAGAAQ
ncbi:MAG: YidC/Oxa1 family membrane protein insertase, partial [Candidatus Doudnabacteria bacterium]|nr:YidC/Oxa1 family membrane protein insertase [Candidatus Doudnabacteria bacterium]